MTTAADLLVLVDLDGTLVRGNSFHIWLRHMVTTGLRTLTLPARLASRLSICFFAALRLGRLISHARLKRACQRVWSSAMARSSDPAYELDSFLAALMRRTDARICDWVSESQRDGAIAVLTTAAPGDYASPLARRLGFDGVVATPQAHSEPWSENLREAKRQNTAAYLQRMGWQRQRTILFTDHIDDLPLMRAVEEVCIVADAETTSHIARQLDGTTRLLSLAEVVGHGR